MLLALPASAQKPKKKKQDHSFQVSKNLEIKNIDFSGGEYGGENSVHGKGLAKFHAKSVLLGDSVPGWVDYILLALAVLGVGALIFVPALRKKKKTKD